MIPIEGRFSGVLRATISQPWFTVWAAWGLVFLVSTAVVGAQDFTYITNNDSITITGYLGAGGAVTIPDAINGLRVTDIGNGAFDGCTNLTSVMLPDSVISIGYSAFARCRNLTTITIPNSVTNIGHSTFSSCPSLTSVTIPVGVSRIEGSMFNACLSFDPINKRAPKRLWPRTRPWKRRF
jgi:hypothetical protein